MFDLDCHSGSIQREHSPDEAAVDQAFAMAGCLARDLVPDSADQASMHLIDSSSQTCIPLFAHVFVFCILFFVHSIVGLFNPCMHFVHPFIHSFIGSFIHSFIRSFVRSFVRSFIHSFSCSPVHLFICALSHMHAFSRSCNRQFSKSNTVLIGSFLNGMGGQHTSHDWS